MSNFITALEKLADQFNYQIKSVNGAIPVYTEDFGWDNYRYTSPIYRLAHVEKFVQEKFAVVHVCIFPHINDPSPIFGFDVIAGEKKATGLFFDLSPTVTPGKKFTNITVKTEREKPEWGDIFSDHWIACRPSFEEFTIIADEAVRVLDQYLMSLNQEKVYHQPVIEAQNRYCINQKQNIHTFSALKNLLGPERAQIFMNTVLFPEFIDVV